jgi:hypothetical protein
LLTAPIPGGLGCPAPYTLIGADCVLQTDPDEVLFTVVVTPPTASAFGTNTTSGIDLGADASHDVELTASVVTTNTPATSTVSAGTIYNPLATWIMDLEPVISGVITNGGLTCSVTSPAAGSASLTISIPGVSLIWLSPFIDATVTIDGPQPAGAETIVFTGPISDAGTIVTDLTTAAAGLHDVTVEAYTITGFRQEMPCPVAVELS